MGNDGTYESNVAEAFEQPKTNKGLYETSELPDPTDESGEEEVA